MNLIEIRKRTLFKKYHDSDIFNIQTDANINKSYRPPKYKTAQTSLEKTKNEFIDDVEIMAKKYGHKVGKTIGENIYEKAPTILTSCPYNESLQLSINSCILLLRRLK